MLLAAALSLSLLLSGCSAGKASAEVRRESTSATHHDHDRHSHHDRNHHDHELNPFPDHDEPGGGAFPDSGSPSRELGALEGGHGGALAWHPLPRF